MQQIKLDEQLYRKVQSLASEAGFETVDEYVADVLEHDVDAQPENFDFLFTPARLAHIDRAAAEIDAGQGLSIDQVERDLAERRTEWLNQNRR